MNAFILKSEKHFELRNTTDRKEFGYGILDLLHIIYM